MPRKSSVLFRSEDTLKLRERLGLSQKDLASFGRISKSLLAMIEIRKRSWPRGKSDTELYLAYAEGEKNPADLSEFVKPDASELNVWNKRLHQIQNERFRKENDLERMAINAKAARRLLQTCIKLRESHPEKVKQKPALINLWEHLAKERILENNESEQDWLKLRLKQLEEEQALVERAIQKIKEGKVFGESS